MQRSQRAKKGQVLIGAVFVLIIISILAMVAATMISTESFSAVNNLWGIQALNIAEAGMRFTIVTSLAADSDWSDNLPIGPIALGAGSFSVRYISSEALTCTIEVTGTVQGVSRTVRSGVTKLFGGIQGIAQNYVVYLGNGSGGSSVFGNNGAITGDLFVNGDLNLGGATVSGDAYATGNISGSSGVQGTSEGSEPAPTQRPSLETSYYDNQINIAKSITATVPPYYFLGNKAFSDPLSPGEYYVKGNVTLNSLTLTGVTTIVATGTVTIGNNQTFGNYLTVICGGTITMGNSTTIGNYGLWYSSAGIVVGNTGDVANLGVGTGTAFITPGNITMGNTAKIDGFIYAGGTLTVGNNLTFNGLMIVNKIVAGNNATLSLNPTVINYNAINGINLTAGSSDSIIFSTWGEYY